MNIAGHTHNLITIYCILADLMQLKKKCPFSIFILYSKSMYQAAPYFDFTNDACYTNRISLKMELFFFLDYFFGIFI